MSRSSMYHEITLAGTSERRMQGQELSSHLTDWRSSQPFRIEEVVNTKQAGNFFSSLQWSLCVCLIQCSR